MDRTSKYLSRSIALVSNTDSSVVQVTPRNYNDENFPMGFNLTLLKKGSAWLTFQDLYDGQTIRVKAEGPCYNVQFDTKDGSSVPKQLVLNGTKATKPANPTKSEYVFAGWTTDQNAFTTSTEFNFDSAINSDVTLYAIWIDPVYLSPVYNSATNVTCGIKSMEQEVNLEPELVVEKMENKVTYSFLET